MNHNDIRIDVINTIKAKGFSNQNNDVCIDDHLKNDLKMDSLDVLELEVELEKKYDVRLQLEFLETPWTVKAVVNKIYSLKCDEA